MMNLYQPYIGRHEAPRRTAYTRSSTHHRRPRRRVADRHISLLNEILFVIIAILAILVAVVACIKANAKPQATASQIATRSYQADFMKYTVDADYEGLIDDFDPVNDAEHQVPETVPITTEPEEEPLEPIVTTRLGVTVSSYDNNVDYTAAIDETYAMIDDDLSNVDHVLSLCEVYEAQRNLKIEDNDLNMEQTSLFSIDNSYEAIEEIRNPHVSYYDYTEQELIWLACIIYAEAGSSWCTDAHQQDVGSVVMRRVESPKFPDTIYDVIHAPGQYPSTCNNTKYDQRSLENARQVLEYGPTTVGVFQANFKQGSEVVATYAYAGHRTTYICV